MNDPQCQLRLTRRFEASPDELWQAITDAESVGRWLGRPLRFDLYGAGEMELELSDGTSVTASVRKLDPPHLMELEWADEEGQPSLVSLTLMPEDEVTVLVLDHVQIGERFGMRYLGRWDSSLDRLAKRLG